MDSSGFLTPTTHGSNQHLQQPTAATSNNSTLGTENNYTGIFFFITLDHDFFCGL
jgi:hypothetical protein